MNNTPEIKDIYIPDSVSALPLAYGWWVILFGIVLAFWGIKFVLWSIKKSRKHYALKKLKEIDENDVIGAGLQISNLLRRVCSIKYKEASSLYGKEWIDFLTQNKNNSLSKKAMDLLIFAPFMDKKSKKYTVNTAKELKSFCKKWIGENL